MDSYITAALDIVKAQAKVRTMTEGEITSMVTHLAAGIRAIESLDGGSPSEGGPVMSPDAKKAIRERSITCLESGKSFKVITRKHLAKFGLTPDEYREKWGYPKGMPLVCKGLQRERRKKMREMRLWERRGKKTDA